MESDGAVRSWERSVIAQWPVPAAARLDATRHGIPCRLGGAAGSTSTTDAVVIHLEVLMLYDNEGDASDDPIARTAHWIIARGVAVEPWPCTGPIEAASPLAHPVLHLVEPGADPPPFVHELDDWVRLPAEPEELIARADALLARAHQAGTRLVFVDADDILRVGDRRAILSPLESRLMRRLLRDVGRVVPWDAVVEEMWPDGERAPSSVLVSNRLRSLRRQIADLPVCIHTVRGRGLILEVGGTHAHHEVMAG